MIVEVAFLPPGVTELHSKLCIVIDVLRATSTLVSMFEAGARRVVLSESIPGALERADAMAERPLVCGESGGLPPAGFDMGNSPREFLPGSLNGRELVFCTSNGTRAMRYVAEAPVVLTGSMLNGSAAVRAALREARERDLNVAIICSGDFLGTRFAIDDAFCAGYLLSLLQKATGGASAADAGHQTTLQDGEVEVDVVFDESAVAALRLYRSYLVEIGITDPHAAPSGDAILRAFWESHNAQVLRKVGLSDDVRYCSQLDISTVVPRLHVEDGTLALQATGAR